MMRECPFNGCGKTIKPEMFACRKHWFQLPGNERDAIYEAHWEYLADKIDVEELRRRQQLILGNRGTV